MKKKDVAYWKSFHKRMVEKILDKCEKLPWAEYETHWFKRGQKHWYKNKERTIITDKPILISSYLEVDGITIRISNHEKKSGYAPGTRNYVYDEVGQFTSKFYPPK
ncbi:MAG: hypothetical protein J5598_00615 [Clostridia bacterium]|nr:hypothetical protein [Clostridia bacterium]